MSEYLSPRRFSNAAGSLESEHNEPNGKTGMKRTADQIFRFANSVDSVRELAKRRLPRGLFEFIDRGSDDEVALINNRAAFDRECAKEKAGAA